MTEGLENFFINCFGVFILIAIACIFLLLAANFTDEQTQKQLEWDTYCMQKGYSKKDCDYANGWFRGDAKSKIIVSKESEV